MEQVALRPPEVVVDAAQQKAYEAELAKVMNVPLPVSISPPSPLAPPLSSLTVPERIVHWTFPAAVLITESC